MNTPETDQNERPTPETDANASFSIHSHILVPVEFARKLERERDEARKEAEYYKERYEQLKDQYGRKRRQTKAGKPQEILRELRPNLRKGQT